MLLPEFVCKAIKPNTPIAQITKAIKTSIIPAPISFFIFYSKNQDDGHSATVSTLADIEPKLFIANFSEFS